MAPSSRAPAAQLPLLYLAVFVAFLGQQMLNPVIAPLSREIGLDEWQVGALISTAAVLVVVSSSAWGRASQSRGRKPILVTAFLLATVAMVGFTVAAGLGLGGALSGTTLFVVLLITRGALFGLAIAAVAPTAQAFIADITSDEKERVSRLAAIGAAQGLSIALGSAAGGLLAVFGLLVPIAIVPILLAIGTVVLALALTPQATTDLIAAPRKVAPLDSRVWPFLTVGFLMFSALGFILIVTGFLVQDRLGVAAEQTAALTGLANLGAGAALILMQAVAVPRLGWRPRRLIIVGGVIAFFAMILLLLDLGFVGIVVSVTALGVGIGLGLPGYTAGPTLLVARDEQGGVAGLTAATNALTFVIAPIAATSLYGIGPLYPIAISAALLGLMVMFALLHPRIRASAIPVTEIPAPQP